MSTNTPTVDETYRRYAELLLRHHHLLAAGREETAETDAVEEEMTQLWDQLTAAQRSSLSGLGSDLSWLRRGCAPAPRGRRAEEISADDLQDLSKAHDEGDWHGLLHCLRLCAATTPARQLAVLRASAWAALKFPNIASLFQDQAAELEASKG